ncbi:MAG: DegT/DnrJ/EryC1/StrS family aminotransferase [Thermoanaerobaculia bacterium]
MISVPVFDLDRALEEIREELDERWRSILESKHFVGGAEVGEFECAFAGLAGSADCVGVGNGTDALILALKALGAGSGDEVVVPAFTFAATAATVEWVGALPVFADVEAATLNLDPERLEAAITERTVGVIGVHLYGQPCALKPIQEICRGAGLWLIEDAAQAHGARYRERPVGAFGDLATWSFYPSKNLGCFGDGGAVTGGDSDAVTRVRLLANHGAPRRYEHVLVGTNSRLDAFQAAVLNCRLVSLEAKNRRRAEIAERYQRGLAGARGVVCLATDDRSEPVYHQMTVLADRRDELQAFLAERGIGSTVHYPTALPDQAAFASSDGIRGDCPVARRAASEVLCLPMFPELSDAEADLVITAVREFAAGA